MIAPRPSRDGDEPALRSLWKTVFGDTDAFLDVFFREVYTPGMASLIETDGTIAAAAYAVPFGDAPYIYAVATLPAYRRRGYGKAVTLSAAAGRPAYLCPAGPELDRWYREEMGAVPADRRGRLEDPGDRRPISPEEYALRREDLLRDTPHAVYTPGILALYALGGGFYAFDARRGEPGGICAVDRDGTVRERLPAPPAPASGVYLLGLNGAPPLYWGLTLE